MSVTRKNHESSGSKSQENGGRKHADANGAVLRHLGVGIDTARYGHHVTFLREDKQPAATTRPLFHVSPIDKRFMLTIVAIIRQ